MIDNKPILSILIVDDQLIFRELHKACISAFLKGKIAFEMATAEGLYSAMKIAESTHINILLTDMQMDDRCDCGLILSKQFRLLYPDSDIYIVTNSDIRSIAKDAIASGVTACFQMPLNDEDLETIFNGRL